MFGLFESPQIKHLKRRAKTIKKNHPYLSLMQIQHSLSTLLGFKKWGDLIQCAPEELQRRIDQTDFERIMR